MCVHPFRVGLAPGRYASHGEALPETAQTPAPAAEDLELPEDLVDLEAWLVAVLRVAAPSRLASALAEAEAAALERFAAQDVVAAMRRVLACR